MGIRDITMGSEKEEKKEKYKSNLFDDEPTWWNKPKKYKKNEYEPTKEEIERDEKESFNISGYEKKRQNQIVITMIVKEEQIEDVMDQYWTDANWQPVEDAVIKIAYDRLKELLTQDFESKYNTIFVADECYGSVEVIITLEKI
jgi:hypothetical protein